MKDPVCLLCGNLYGHPLAGLLCEKYQESVLLKVGFEKVKSWECLYVHRTFGTFLSVCVDDFKMAGRSVNLQKGWDTITKAGIRLDPPEELGHFLGCSTKLVQISEETASARLEHLQPLIQAQSSYDSYYGEETPDVAGGGPPALAAPPGSDNGGTFGGHRYTLTAC